MSILTNIIENKRAEVGRLAERCSLEELRAQAAMLHTPRGFASALRGPKSPAVIAEIKRASPSRGAIRPDLDPLTTAHGYAAAGAACLSVLTDEKFFAGSPDYIPAINRSFQESGRTSIPILRKDFIIDPLQVWQTRAMGADAVLLIVAALSDRDLAALMGESVQASLDVLLEVHTEEELERGAVAFRRFFTGSHGLSKPLLGINNRDLHRFVTDLEVTKRIASRAKTLFADTPQLADLIVVSESGISTAEDLTRLREYGASAFLIGEALVTEGDPGTNLSKLLHTYRTL